MQYTTKYKSPLGEMLIAADDTGLIGVWFIEQKYFPQNLYQDSIQKETTILKNTKKWLDIYFTGKEPNFKLPLHFSGTSFQNEVWEILNSIPYGKTTTYGDIAKILAIKKGIKRMSAQAVGGAIGKNKISIIVPCHRVVGANGNLTGYAGGVDKKMALLKIERRKQK